MVKYDNEAQLAEAGQYWQRQLRLQDWEIYYFIKKHFDMPRAGCDGNGRITESNKHAYIYLLAPKDHEYEVGYDMERTLVHELLHLPMNSFAQGRDGRTHIQEEQFIECLADTLVRLNRGTRR